MKNIFNNKILNFSIFTHRSYLIDMRDSFCNSHNLVGKSAVSFYSLLGEKVDKHTNRVLQAIKHTYTLATSFILKLYLAPFMFQLRKNISEPLKFRKFFSHEQSTYNYCKKFACVFRTNFFCMHIDSILGKIKKTVPELLRRTK